MRVQVSRVDLDGRKIDFRMVHEGENALLSRGRRDKPAADSAVAELEAVKEADRAIKSAAKAAKGLSAKKSAAHPVRAAKKTAKAAGKTRGRRR